MSNVIPFPVAPRREAMAAVPPVYAVEGNVLVLPVIRLPVVRGDRAPTPGASS